MSHLDDLPQAVDRAIADGKLSLALSLADQCALSLLERGEIARLRRWIDALPDEHIFQWPRLSLAMAMFRYGDRELDASLWFLGSSARMLDAALSDAELNRQILALQPGHAICRDDSQTGRKALDWLISSGGLSAHLPEDRLCEAWCTLYERGPAAATDILRTAMTGSASGSDLLGLHQSNLAGVFARLSADLDQSESIYRHMKASAERAVHPAPDMAALAAAGLAANAYEWGRLEEVEDLLGDQLSALLETGSVEGIIAGYYAWIRTLAANSAFPLAHIAISDVANLAVRRGWPRLAVFAMAERVAVFLAEGSIANAQSCAAELEAVWDLRAIQTDSTLAATIRTAHLAIATVQLAAGEPDRAAATLSELSQALARLGFHYENAGVSTLLAVALDQAGRSAEARDAAVAALTIGQNSRLLRTFADCDPGFKVVARNVRKSLTARSARRLTISYVDEVLDYLDANASDERPSYSGLLQRGAALSAREAELMILISRGMSNKEIARMCGISNETVKWHLRNLYEKLCVSGRRDAVPTLRRMLSGHKNLDDPGLSSTIQ